MTSPRGHGLKGGWILASILFQDTTLSVAFSHSWLLPSSHPGPGGDESHIPGSPVLNPTLSTEALRCTGSGSLRTCSFSELQATLKSSPASCPQCLAAGSIIMNRELESMAMRPLAKELTRSLEDVRGTLRDQALRDLNTYTEKMREALRRFDVLFAEFELR